MDPGYFDTERKQNPREKASFLSKMFFWYTRPLFVKGRKGQLSISDVYRCSPQHRAAPRGDVIGEKWKEELIKKENGKKPSLLRAMVKIHGLKYFIVNFIFTLIDSGLRISIPLCLEGFINYFSKSHAGIPAQTAYLYAFGVVGMMAMSSMVLHPMVLWLYDISMKCRVACCSLIYRKLLRLDLTTGGKASEGLAGHVINLLTTDAQRFDMATIFMVDLVKTPLESVLVVIVMYRQIGVASLIGVSFLLLFIPLQGYLGKITSKLRRQTAVRTDNRIRLMNEVIQSIEAVKMYAWENAFARIIGHARKKEMNVIKKISWLRAVMISCVKLNTKVATFLSIISFLHSQNELTAAKVFVIFSYYEILKYSLVDFLPLAITFALEAYVSVKRMEEFLLLPEVDNQDFVDLVTIDENENVEKRVFEKIGNGEQTYIKSDSNLSSEKPQVLLSMKDYTAHWRNVEDKDHGQIAALTDINLTIKPSTLTTIVGTVGAGKSTLLQAMLRELPASAGHLQVKGTVAYAGQEPWLFEASVRQNILFGQEMDLQRYKKVIRCCQLKSDLEILSHGDKTIVGERGASLSGGQRARISLARCVYQHADVYLLDDPLAAVDARVAQAIYEECIRGYLRDKATVLVTHHVQYARRADLICVMRAGKIVAQGTYQELKNGVSEFEKLIEMGEKFQEEKQKQKVNYEAQDSVEEILTQVFQKVLEHNQKLRPQRSVSQTSQVSFNLDLDSNLDPEYEGESQAKGSVDSSAYMAYIRSGGGKWSVSLLFTLFIVAQIFYSSTEIWLKEWVNLEEAYSAANKTSAIFNTTPPVFEDMPNNHFNLTQHQMIYVYASLIGTCILFTWNKLVLFYNTCIKASTSLHDTMFRGVTNAPMWFFHHNPSGRILNRFAKDMGQVDTLLPVVLVDCFGFFLEVVSILIVVCLINWWLVLPTALLASMLFIMRNIFLSTSREIKRVEAIARSQSLSHCAATVSGLATIRSARAQQRTLAREFDKLQDLHSSAWGLVCSTNKAFGLWMDLLCCVYLALVTFSFFFFTSDDAIGGNVGLAITQVIALVGMCQYGMRQTAEVENQMTSVERILEYKNLPPESPVDPDEQALKALDPDFDFDKWPSKGEIIFEDVSLEYEKPPKTDPPKKLPTELPKTEHPSEVPMLEHPSKIPKIEHPMEMPKIEHPTELPKIEHPQFAIRGVNFTVRPTEKVAVVGRTGAGKSSLIAALFGLSKITGRVSVDGVQASQAGLRAWRARLCALPQRPALFAASLRDNLDPQGRYSDAQIYAALDQVELREMVSNLPAGLSTKVGDGGGNLSSGQRQLICLARAALAGSSVLVLDEATANVDTETDKQIQATIRNKFANSTVLTIAHRLNTVMDYDRVIVMDKGHVVETGHPFELLSQNNAPTRRSLLSKSPAPLAIPEEYESASRLENPKETVVLGGGRMRTHSNRSELEEGGIFKSLVEQTGPETARMLYKMAEESYQKMLERRTADSYRDT